MKKILILLANPKDTIPLRLGEEVREIQEALKLAKHREQFEIATSSAVRVEDLCRAMLDHHPHIVHFSGHGAGTEGLAFEDNSGTTQLVSGEALASLFELFRGTVECVLLNACYSEVQAQAIHQHVDYVIGINQSIGDVAAIEFAVGFYDALGALESYDYAFRMGCTAIQLKGSQQHLTPVIKSRPSGINLRQDRPSSVSVKEAVKDNIISKKEVREGGFFGYGNIHEGANVGNNPKPDKPKYIINFSFAVILSLVSIAALVFRIYIGINGKPDIKFLPFTNPEASLCQFNGKYPQSWTYKVTNNPITHEILIFTPPEISQDEPLVKLIILCSKPQHILSLSEYTSEVINRRKNLYANVSIQVKTTTFSTHEASQLTYTTKKNKENWIVREVITLDKGIAYQVIYMANATQYHKYDEAATQIIRSFNI